MNPNHDGLNRIKECALKRTDKLHQRNIVLEDGSMTMYDLTLSFENLLQSLLQTMQILVW